ncbi:MAG: Cof-type HAD-IIB family hydrolase [Spirochaetales bacterium]|jgi:hydroxymethylpyrimidine pyrophosphatase-like HAD family hydrolase|nr:Cof-type HAD-IIB family hydrolase [Spirochaetales bacterium]
MYRAAAVFDFDGTLCSRRGLPPRNLAMLADLKVRGVCRIIATGRSLDSFRQTADRLAPAGFPLDFLIFSSGAGMTDWQTGEIFPAGPLEAPEVRKIWDRLLGEGLDFMIHFPVPHNHRFYYLSQSPPGANPDFERRLSVHWGQGEVLPEGEGFPASQFVVIYPPHRAGEVPGLSAGLEEFSLIRATSPLDGISLWMEIFPRGINKGSGLNRLLESLGLEEKPLLALGNDFNDLDLLAAAKKPLGTPCLVADAPPELRGLFPQTLSCDEAGAAQAAEKWLRDNRL